MSKPRRNFKTLGYLGCWSFRKKQGIVQQRLVLLLLLCGSAQSAYCATDCKTCASDSNPAGKWWYPSETGGFDNICDNGKYYNSDTGMAANYYSIRGCCGCAKGKYFDMEEHSANYKVTGDGGYGSYHSFTSCDNCPNGWVAISIGSSSCNKCGLGKSSSNNQDNTGKIINHNCEDCEIGKYNNVRGGSCKSCPAGRSTSKGATSEGSCSCVAGTIKTSSAPVTCTTCAAGKYRTGLSTDTGDTCLNCDAGKYIEADQDP